MTKEFYRIGNYKPDHSTFGGLIFESDFNTEYRCNSHKKGSSIADRIVSDWKFDESCKKKKSNITNWRKTSGN